VKRGPGRHSSAGLAALGPPDPEDLQRYLAESRGASDEYARWLDGRCEYRVGKPGFFSRYGAGMEGDWKMYFVSDAPDLQPTSFDDAVSRFDRVWFGEPPADLPADICLITRDIDHAYLDLFFRDEWMFKSVWGYTEGRGMKPDFEEHERRLRHGRRHRRWHGAPRD
jgi:hypothetical protein